MVQGHQTCVQQCGRAYLKAFVVKMRTPMEHQNIGFHPSIPINHLLIGVVSLVLLLTSHVGMTKEVPALGIGQSSFKGLYLKRRSILMV